MKLIDLPYLIEYNTPVPEGVLPCTLGEGMLHRVAQKNLNRQALLGFSTRSVSTDLAVLRGGTPREVMEAHYPFPRPPHPYLHPL